MDNISNEDKEKAMLTFLLILVLVFVAVDLFVQLVIDPLAVKLEEKKKHQTKSINIIEPKFSLVGATMYDGGKAQTNEQTKTDVKEETKK